MGCCTIILFCGIFICINFQAFDICLLNVLDDWKTRLDIVCVCT